MRRTHLFTTRQVLFAGMALLISSAAMARGAPCPQQFSGGNPPTFINKKLAAQTYGLCFQEYATMFSGITRTPLWSYEHLTADRVEGARQMKRNNAFHPEDRLPPNVRSELYDYVRSGYDRGHMAPSGDFDNPDAQYESFSLANIVPQNPNNNQGLWSGLESATRNLAQERGELYVVTGPLFEGANLQRLNGRVLVPTYIWKAIYDPKRQEASAYVSPNAPGMNYQVVSITELERRTGINIFPGMPDSVKQRRISLPEPMMHGHGRGHGQGSRRYHSYDRYGEPNYREYRPRQEDTSPSISGFLRKLFH